MRRVKWLWVFLIALLLTGVLFNGRRFYNKQAYPPPAPSFIPTHTQPQTNNPRRTAVPTRSTPAVSAPAKISDLTKAKDDQASEPCRITALRVAALHGAKEVLPVARELAQTGKTEMLRMAAIASLGELGGTADQELLDALTHADVPYVASIATQAAAILKNRMVPTR